jgi:DNA-binding response OmpR family regulator
MGAPHNPETTKRVLVIEDEPDMLRGLRDAMQFEGFDVVAAGTGTEGIDIAKRHRPDLVLLDLMLPDMNGFKICEELRRLDSRVPIIMLTARSQEADKIRGFDVGADDYVTKPFSVGELMARIGAIFRRQERISGAEEVLTIGRAQLDIKKHALTVDRKTHLLTFYEVELLKLLYERLDEPVSRDEILEKIWGIGANPTNRTVDNFIVKLRKKVEENPKDPRHILTVYGFGYKLVL